nr:wall-associated receptor kinase-like 1 [Ipomoea batatas]
MILLFVFLFFPSAAAAAAPSLAKRGCEEWCGNVSIPFPFGIGEGCALDSWFLVKCDNSSNPPKPYLNSFLQIELQRQVVAVSLTNQTVTTLKSVVNSCDNSAGEGRNAITNGTDLSGSPFYYSKSRNKFLFGGCGNSLLTQNSAVLAGCTAICGANTSSGLPGCYGIDCCESPIPFDLSSYSANFTNSGIGGSNLDRCNSAFLVDQTWIPKQSTSLFIEYAPVVWIWTVQSKDFPAATICRTSDDAAVQLADGTSVSNFRCDCPTGEEGNPYIAHGCQDTEDAFLEAQYLLRSHSESASTEAHLGCDATRNRHEFCSLCRICRAQSSPRETQSSSAVAVSSCTHTRHKTECSELRKARFMAYQSGSPLSDASWGVGYRFVKGTGTKTVQYQEHNQSRDFLQSKSKADKQRFALKTSPTYPTGCCHDSGTTDSTAVAQILYSLMEQKASILHRATEETAMPIQIFINTDDASSDAQYLLRSHSESASTEAPSWLRCHEKWA